MQCLLKQRFSGQAQNGSIRNNILECHPARRVRTKELLSNILILCRSNDDPKLGDCRNSKQKLCTLISLAPTSTPRKNFVMIRYIRCRIPFIHLLIVEAQSVYVGFRSG